MNLYWKRLFGKITPTARLEAQYQQSIADAQRYRQICGSPELAEYNELFNKIKSPEFKENKRTLISRKYKDTQWYRDMTKFTKLEHNAGLQLYYRVLESPELKEYLEFKQKPEYTKLGQPKEVKASEELSRLKRFEQSKEYKTYTRFHNSYILREYTELKEKVSTQDFKQNNDFWANRNRWQTTSEYKMEQRFYELDKSDDICFYNRYKNSKTSNLFQNYHKLFEDGFDGNTLKTDKWAHGFAYNTPVKLRNHSFANEKQANSDKNAVVTNGILRISTKSEQTDAIAWHPEKGFVQKNYEFTSDAVNCRNAVFTKGGIFQAKMRIFGSDQVNHAFWLQGDNKNVLVKVASFTGGVLEVGLHCKHGNGIQNTTTRITGLKFNEFYIYTVQWTDKEIIWYVNNYEVLRTSADIPAEPMAPVFNSYIPEDRKGGTANFDIAFVRVMGCKE